MPEPDHLYIYKESPKAKPKPPPWHIGENWVDLYAILQVKNDAKPRELEEAIISRVADCLSFAFSRGSKPELVRLIERHLHEFRPILLNPENRRCYDEQLARHLVGDSRAQSYSEFVGAIQSAQKSAPAG